MEEVCEHLESSPIGHCSICGRTVCTDCYREIFNAMICDQHEKLEDEGEWELVGYYAVGTDKLLELMHTAGFTGVERLDERFFQPLLVGHRAP